MIVFGHEPGGGTQAMCQATSSEFNRTLWFLDADTGEDMGHFVHPRPQGPTENCTWHNGTVVPLKNKAGKPRYVWLSGNYQSGISAVDFSDPMNPFEFAYVDPPPNVHPTNPNAILAGGDRSTYWYNGRIYQSDMRRRPLHLAPRGPARRHVRAHGRPPEPADRGVHDRPVTGLLGP
jgi:hypothetical protein